MSEIKARILFWGIEGAGSTTTLQTIHAKLRADLRGELRSEPTRLDPTVHHESLPITLGEVGGVGTQIELVAVPGAPDQAMTRKQLLDQVDGIVLVLDCSAERIEENFSAVEELRQALAAYGHRLDAFPIVLQYNKRDIADPFAIEDLHRRIGVEQAAVFETIATTGHGILSTLTTIAKHVIRARRSTAPAVSDTQSETEPLLTEAVVDDDTAPSRMAAEIEEVSPSHEVLEAAILAEGEGSEELAEAVEIDFSDGAQPDWNAVTCEAEKPEGKLGGELRIVSAGQPTVEPGGGVRLPLVLGDEDGQTRSVVLSLRLDALAADGCD